MDSSFLMDEAFGLPHPLLRVWPRRSGLISEASIQKTTCPDKFVFRRHQWGIKQIDGIINEVASCVPDLLAVCGEGLSTPVAP